MVGAVNVKAMDLATLVALRDEVTAEISAKEATASADFIVEMRELAVKRGLKLSELVDVKRSIARAMPKAAAKYRNPEDHAQTWAGRGKKPKWVEAHLASGGALSALAIEPDAEAPRKGKRKQES